MVTRLYFGLVLMSFFATNSRSEPLKRIHFGSCVKQEKPMPLLKAVVAGEPDLFIFLGDNIYADTKDPTEMRAKYAKLDSNPDFSALRETCPLLATWDDHDYGMNDAGSEYPMKAESQSIFLDFWGAPKDAPRRKREGVFDARIFGPKGKRVQIILLDTRYFRGPLKTGEKRVGGRYYPDSDPSVPMLGDAQWKWVEEQLKKPAELRLVASSIQFIAESAGQETWSNLPTERQRMIDLISKTKANGVIFISGDRHWSELSAQTKGVPYSLYDLTSSALNQIHPRGTPTENRYRISETTLHRPNYGVIDIDWDQPDPKITLRIRDEKDNTRIEKDVRLSTLANAPK